MIRFLSFLIILTLTSPTYADEDKKFDAKAPEGQFSELKHTKSGRIDKVIDGLTITLKDGTIIHLASIDIPDFHIWDHAFYSDDAFKLLKEKLPERTEVMLYQTVNPKKGRVNRHDQQLAQVVIKDNNEWIQGLLLANGLARAYPAPDSAEMMPQMLEIEKQARKEKRGAWENDSEFKILTSEQTTTHIGELVIVEGIVENVSTVRNNIYINFGKDWKKDFTVKITPELRKKFARENIQIMGLERKPLRVRGYLKEYNGPMIELEDISHLEILDLNKDKGANENK